MVAAAAVVVVVVTAVLVNMECTSTMNGAPGRRPLRCSRPAGLPARVGLGRRKRERFVLARGLSPSLACQAFHE